MYELGASAVSEFIGEMSDLSVRFPTLPLAAVTINGGFAVLLLARNEKRLLCSQYNGVTWLYVSDSANSDIHGGDAVNRDSAEHGVDVSQMRRSYHASGTDDLDATWLTGEPPWLALMQSWMADCVAAGVVEPNAMVVATVGDDGMPSTRTVLCKGFDARGVVFYTNHRSDKARNVAARPVASATFPWISLQRQVHFRGTVVPVSRDESREYWATRPRGSQLGAIASDQSHPIASLGALADQSRAVAEQFSDVDDIPLPENWGGYRIEPRSVEFWQGRENRLHNRIRAVASSNGWDITRLQP